MASESTTSSKAESVEGSNGVSRVEYAGDNNEFIILGGHKFERHKLVWPTARHEYGNAAALGLSAFGMCAFVFGLYLTEAGGVEISSVVLSLTFSHGGIIEFLAGIWEMANGETFNATLFVSLGAFFLSYSLIFFPSFGIAAAYAEAPEQLGNAVGFMMLGWFLLTTVATLAVLKSTIPMLVMLLTLDLTLLLIAVNAFTGNHATKIAGGVTFVISGVCAWYVMYTIVANKKNTYVVLPSLNLPVLGNKH